jgi:hypothetical protein
MRTSGLRPTRREWLLLAAAAVATGLLASTWHLLFPPERSVPAADVLAAAGRLAPDAALLLHVRKPPGASAAAHHVVSLPLAFAPRSEGEDDATVGRRRVGAAGLALSIHDGRVRIDAVRAASAAGALGLGPSVDVIEVRVVDRQPAAGWQYLPALLAAGGVGVRIARRAVAARRAA